MKRIIPNRPIRGTVKATESKSYAHRYLIASYLSGAGSELLFENHSDDVMATQEGLKALLAADQDTPTTVICNNSGTTFRFLLPIAAALGRDIKFMISNALASRPTEPLYETLIAHGASVKVLDYEEEKCVRTRDKLFPGEFEIPGYISSQFVSGLLFALPLLNGQSRLLVLDRLHSKSYVDMTIAVLREAGIEIIEEQPDDGDERISAVYRIPGNQKYSLKGNVTIEGDWSNAAVWLTAGALSGPVTCTGLNLQSRQSDRMIVDILKEMGAQIEEGEDSVTVSKGNLTAISIDLTDNPDIVPSVCLAGAAAKGETEIGNVDRRRFAEYNRLKTVKAELKKLEEETDQPYISMDCFGDHRIAMVEAVSACIASKPVELAGAEAVNKSYPAFFDDLDSLMK